MKQSAAVQRHPSTVTTQGEKTFTSQSPLAGCQHHFELVAIGPCSR